MGTMVPFIGLPVEAGANYALFKMMQQNPGYDVVIYPQVESYRHAPVLGTDIYSKTTYKVTARLGKLKKKIIFIFQQQKGELRSISKGLLLFFCLY